MRYSTVLFDLDHTLFDTHASEAAAFDATMRSIGLDATPELFTTYDRLNQALWRRVESGELGPNDIKVHRFEQFLETVDVVADPMAMATTFVSALADHGDLYADASELLDELRGSCRLALVTNGIGSVQRGRLRRVGLDEGFAVVSISGELGMSKPRRAIFDHTLDSMGVDDRDDVVMVGDSLVSDIRGGVNAGIDTVWFNPHQQGNHTDVRPTHEISALADIPALVLGDR